MAKPELRRWWPLLVGAAVAVAVLFLHYKERNSYRCRTCFAIQDAFQWRVGSWSVPSLPLSPTWKRTKETHFARDLLPSGHVHDWAFEQASPYRWFGTRWSGCGVGGADLPNDLLRSYETDEDFRAFIRGRIEDGSFSQTEVVRVLSIPWDEMLSDEMHQHLRTGVAASMDEFLQRPAPVPAMSSPRPSPVR